MITIIPPKKGSKHPLFFRRLGELPLPAFLQLDMQRRLVTFGYWERNSEPTDVTLGYELWWQIDAGMTRLAATKIAKELEPLLERICDGYSVQWDGRKHVGSLDADAESAAAKMSTRLGQTLETQI